MQEALDLGIGAEPIVLVKAQFPAHSRTSSALSPFTDADLLFAPIQVATG